MATIVDHGLLSIVPIALLPILPEGRGLYFYWLGSGNQLQGPQGPHHP